MKDQLIYTIEDACDILHISRGTLYSLINQNILKTFKIGGRRMIAHQDLLEFINHQRQKEAA